MEMLSSRQLGVAALVSGIILAVACWVWLRTRRLVPLNIPISMSRGYVKSQEFRPNLDSGYYIEIEVSKSSSFKNLDCLMWGCYGSPAIINARWKLSTLSRVVLSGNSEDVNGGSGNLGTVGRKIGHFKNLEKPLQIEVDVLSDASVLNLGNPRLKVEADGDGYNHLGRLYIELFILPGLLLALGGALLFLKASEEETRVL